MCCAERPGLKQAPDENLGAASKAIAALPSAGSQPDQYGVHDTGETMSPPGARGIKPITEDVLTRAASSMTFGTAEKAKAAIWHALGEGKYDELLAK